MNLPSADYFFTGVRALTKRSYRDDKSITVTALNNTISILSASFSNCAPMIAMRRYNGSARYLVAITAPDSAA
ncbi:MAG: hypothetical protein ACRECO_14490 [Xanthobacteraceae bacterium]